MGRKSKRRGGKSKGGGKQHSPSDRTDEIITALSSMSRLTEEGNGTGVLRGDDMEQVPELKTQRDETADPKTIDDFLKDKLSEEELAKLPALSQMMMAMMSLTMAKSGVVEEENHSSISYAEEHADELFADGGEKFFTELKEAMDNAKLGRKKKSDMEKMTNDEMSRDLMSTIEKDEELFQPCPPREDCPICFLPFPGRAASTYQPCCGKVSR
jgi:vacuolar-type H+-ATPase subunit B/Vma2